MSNVFLEASFKHWSPQVADGFGSQHMSQASTLQLEFSPSGKLQTIGCGVSNDLEFAGASNGILEVAKFQVAATLGHDQLDPSTS